MLATIQQWDNCRQSETCVVLLIGSASFAEVLKHVVKGSARLSSYEQMRAAVVDLLCAKGALHMSMDVDGAFLRVHKDKDKRTKGESSVNTIVCQEVNKPGHLRKDSCVYNKRIVQKGNTEEGEKVEGTAGAMVDTWEYADDNCVFALGEAVIIAVERDLTHMCSDCGTLRWACSFGFTFEVTGKHTALILMDFQLMDFQLLHVGTRERTGRHVIQLERCTCRILDGRVPRAVSSCKCLVFGGEWDIYDFSFSAYGIIIISIDSQCRHRNLQEFHKWGYIKWNEMKWNLVVADRSASHDRCLNFCDHVDWIFSYALRDIARGWRQQFSAEEFAFDQHRLPLWTVESRQCALKVRAKWIPETPTKWQRDRCPLSHAFTVGLPMSSMCTETSSMTRNSDEEFQEIRIRVLLRLVTKTLLWRAERPTRNWIS